MNSDSVGGGDKAGQIAQPYAQHSSEVIDHFRVDVGRGLDEAEVEQRRLRYGKNTMPYAAPTPWWRMLAQQFASFLIALLVVAAIVSFASGDHLEGIAILIVVILNALVGFITEFRAREALESLRDQAKTFAQVRRAGREQRIEAEDLVPGDIVVLQAGDRVPADVRLLEAAAVRAEESTLTGESEPVEKSAVDTPPNLPLAERTSMLYLGTSMVAGHALAVVIATGSSTELGQIGKLVTEVLPSQTPLERRLAELGRRLAWLVVAIAGFVFLFGVLRGAPFGGMLKIAISLAVAAIPEGLPAVTTLVLALGVLRMARQKAIVRKLAAVEALGGVTVIATDKTGTLTENRMTVTVFLSADGHEMGVESHPIADATLNLALKTGILCNDAILKEDLNHLGDPTEMALLTAAQSLGIDVNAVRTENPRLEEIPFDPVAKRMVTVHNGPSGKTAYAKGGPAAILDVADRLIGLDGNIHSLDADFKVRLVETNRELGARALRVLALAYKPLDQDQNLSQGFILVGFVGMIDPPRPEVRASIELAGQAGIRVVMMTGDQLATGQAIAGEVGMGDHPVAHHARDLAGASGAELAKIAQTAQVFARVSPEDKLRIVESLQQSGEVVAVTGDGVNDAPALKRADIGVAMGIRGTEVAKEAADVVLMDDNFATIVVAVEEGRTIYANILKFVRFLFTCNLAEVVVVFTATALNLPLPLFPLAILWMNLVTDVFPAFALAVEPSEPQIMKQRPRPPEVALLSREFALNVFWQSLLISAATLAAYDWALRQYGEGAHARTVALLAMVGVQTSQLFASRSPTRSGFHRLLQAPAILCAAGAMVALQLAAVYIPLIAHALGVGPANMTDWLVVLAASLLPLAMTEVVKRIYRARSNLLTQ